jgi:hypothetical protein
MVKVYKNSGLKVRSEEREIKVGLNINNFAQNNIGT